MRRHRIIARCGDKTYYSYWYKKSNKFYLYVRSESLKFQRKLLGIMQGPPYPNRILIMQDISFSDVMADKLESHLATGENAERFTDLEYLEEQLHEKQNEQDEQSDRRSSC